MNTRQARRLYNKFCDGLINCNGLATDPKTRAEAQAMYSFEEYVNGGAYDEDLQSIEHHQRLRERMQKVTS